MEKIKKIVYNILYKIYIEPKLAIKVFKNIKQVIFFILLSNFPFIFKKNIYSFNIKELDGEKVYLRKNTSDKYAILYVFGNQFHIPIDEIKGKSSIILDLGANAGYTMLHYAKKYKNSKILGFELDKNNFDFAITNIQNKKNCTLFNIGIWYKNGEMSYSGKATDDFHIKDNGDIISKVKELNNVIKENNINKIDFIKMDIEGAEGEIFNNNNLEWLKITKHIQIEFHPFFNEKANYLFLKKKLEKYNFKVTRDKRHKYNLEAIKKY